MFGQITQLFDGDGGQDYRLQADTAFQNKNYLQWILLSTDGLLEYTLDIALVPTAILTSKIDTFSQETLGLGLAEMACNLQAHQLLKPAGEALYHFSNWARATAAGTGSAFVTTATNVSIETVNQAAGLVGINGNSVKKDSGISVIGPRANYREFTRKNNYNYLNVTDEEWTRFKNWKYLRNVVRNKDNVVFSMQFDPSKLQEGSVLAWEIEYLENHGYVYNQTLNMWTIQ